MASAGGKILTYLQATAMSHSRLAMVYADAAEGHAVVVDVGALRGLRKEETDGEAAGRGGAARG
jgi:hypothetical protein